jgi:hypothetical protein
MVSPVEPGQPLNFSLSLAPSNRFSATAELAWSDEAGKTGGLQFTSLSSSARLQLQSWLGEHGLPATEFVEAEEPSPASEEPDQEAFAVPVAPPPMASESPRSSPEILPAASPIAATAVTDEVLQAIPHAPGAFTRAKSPDLGVSTAHFGTASFGFARATVAKFKEFLSSAVASEDVQNAPEDLLITAIDFTLITTNACFGFLRTLATPGVIREAAKVAFIVTSIVLLVIVVLSFQGDLGNSLIRLGRDIAGEQEAAPIAPAEAPPSTSNSSSTTSSPTPESPAPQPVRTEKPPAPESRKSVTRPSLSVPGDSQLEIARRYLRGDNGTPRPDKAVPWLWAASHEGNVAADILLGELYIRGEGITQNCQQGIVLLTAAAKKGDPNAASKLRDLDSGPCGSAAKAK